MNKIKTQFLFLMKYGLEYEFVKIKEKLGIKSTRSSNEILAEYNRNISDGNIEKELSDWFYMHTGETLNLKHPQSYNEKIQWLKLYDTTELKRQLTDKYCVRKWVEEKIGAEYLVNLLGVWNTFEKIDFSLLPDKFVLKCNHGCEMNVIVKDKSKIDYEEIKKKFDKWLKIDFSYYTGFEFQYRDIRPCIIAEEYLENDKGELYDYKFWCNNGRCDFIMFLCERDKGLKMANYDRNWNKLDFTYNFQKNEKVVEKPYNLDKMIELAEELAKDFYHVRVDFYRLNNGVIKFGEMTFTSAEGIQCWNPKEINEYLGKCIVLPTDEVKCS